MSFLVLNRKFKEVPKPAEIVQFLLDNTTVDDDKAEKAMAAFMGPMTNFLKMFHLIEGMKVTAERHAALLAEQEELSKTVATARVEAADIKTSTDKDIQACQDSLTEFMDQGEKRKTILAGEIADMEKTKATLSQEIETEQGTKLRLDTTVAAEYDRLRAEMLGKITAEQESLQTPLEAMRKELKEGTTELAQIKAKLDALNAGGGAEVLKSLIG